MFKFRSIPRLTIIFILAVTIPGAVLSYLSIQNITNLKELTERRVLEEEESLAGMASAHFNELLKEVILKFRGAVSATADREHAAIRLSDTISYIRYPFIINNDGSFTWPDFHEDIEFRTESFSAGFRNNYSAAERSEFNTRNFSRALAQYHRALALASGGQDSAKAVNAIARLNNKIGDKQASAQYYYLLISKFHQVEDISGIPYAYYALPQLLGLSGINSEQVLEAIEIVLSRMESGTIPLNYNSGRILEDISAWIRNYELADNNADHALKELVEINASRISFLQNYNTILKEFVKEDNKSLWPKLDSGVYGIRIPGVQEGEPLIITLALENGNTAGLMVYIDSIAQEVARTKSPISFQYEYDLEIIESKPDQLNSDIGIATTLPLHPLVTAKSVLVKLRNKDLPEKDIRRMSWIYGVAITLLLGGMLLGVVLIIRDISREKHLARMRSDFVSNVTHELKTPLTSIYMFAESIMLGRVKTSSDKKEYLGIILRETERLKRLINNILDFSKKEKGKMVYQFVDADISTLVSSALHELNYWIMEKQFQIHTKISEGLIARADPDAFKQAVLNLLSNAIKYSHERKEIYVNAYRKDGDIIVEVIDRGVGISEDKLHRIFDKFYRIEDKDKPENTGTGLGLTVVKEIVEAHHARIFVESEVGKGSKFTITINAE